MRKPNGSIGRDIDMSRPLSVHGAHAYGTRHEHKHALRESYSYAIASSSAPWTEDGGDSSSDVGVVME